MGYKPHTPLNASNINGHIVFGLSGRCADTVFINGECVMSERVIVKVDEDEILAKSREQSKDFWRRAGGL
jgi:cytosine/adenosine deaminase-related metal-dependent hydrolase